MNEDYVWRRIVENNAALRDGAKNVTLPRAQLERLVRTTWRHGYRHGENDAKAFNEAFAQMFGEQS